MRASSLPYVSKLWSPLILLTSSVAGSSQGVNAVLAILDKVEATAQGIPPVDNKASRFGNPAFKTFYDQVSEVRLLWNYQSSP